MFLALALIVVNAACAADAGRQTEQWQSAYGGTDSGGSHVIGHWHFDRDEVAKDSGPNQLSGRLDGAVPYETGKFSGAIESFAGWPVDDKHHAVVVDDHPALSPPGAFTFEMWIQPKPGFESSGRVYLADKKYASQHDYQWQLESPNSSGLRSMLVGLGFGTDSELFVSEPAEYVPGRWYHVAFSYDGAGQVRFFRDGSSLGRVTKPGRRGIAPGRHILSLGDRVGSYYGGFPGYIDEARLCQGALEFNPAAIDLQVDRSVWVRREPNPEVRVVITNLQSQSLAGCTLRLSGIGLPSKDVVVPPIESGQTHQLTWTFDTSLRPDHYRLQAVLTVPQQPPVECRETRTLQIVGRPIAERMPVMMWGIGGPTEFDRELDRLKHLGFTHCLGFGADYQSIWAAGKPVPAGPPQRITATLQMLDRALANEIGIGASLYAGAFLKKRDELQRVDREGRPYARRDCNAALPGLAEFCSNIGASVAKTYGHHPAFQAALINSEVRDDSQLSFSAFDREAYRKFSGSEIPAEVQIKNGVKWTELQDFPADRVIPDDHPILAYYRWFWTVGDGWNNLHTALHQGLKSTGRDDIWTWYDPAIRVPSVSGSGGEVDVLSQWTYTEPSPLRVGYFCDEVFAMAAASARQQQVMKMTQLFWYRSTSAPIRSGQNYIASPFDDHDPDAAYISIAPMHLRGAFWSKISRPVSGLMYHGWSSLVETDGTHAYKFTQPDLQTEFHRLHHEILPAWGPMLLQVPDRPTDVAYLNSFTSQMFARRGSYGYSHDEAFLTLLHAQLQPQVIFEETLLASGLDQFKVLVLVDCDVLTESVVQRIQQFQRDGGVIIGDPNLTPAIQPDIVLPRFRRSKKTDEDKAAILANAAQLRSDLDGRYQRYAECTDPEIVTRVRSTGASDYVFVVNDRRTFGDYVGQHGLVMEHGLPSQGLLRLRRANSHVYDLQARRRITAQTDNKTTSWAVQLGPCDGNLFLVTPEAIDQVEIAAPESAVRGEQVQVVIRVVDGAGQPIPAAIPLHVQTTDPHGRPAECSGYCATRNGQLELPLDLASNDTAGVWQIQVRELADGRIGRHYIEVD